MPIGSHRFYFGSLNEYEVDRLAENIGLCRGKLLGEDLRFDERQFLPHPDRYAAIVDPGGGNALVIGEGPLCCGAAGMRVVIAWRAFASSCFEKMLLPTASRARTVNLVIRAVISPSVTASPLMDLQRAAQS